MRGRPQLPYTTRYVKVYLKEELLERFEEYTWDPRYQRTKYGLRSAVFNRLLEDLLDALDGGRTTISIAAIARMLQARRPA